MKNGVNENEKKKNERNIVLSIRKMKIGSGSSPPLSDQLTTDVDGVAQILLRLYARFLYLRAAQAPLRNALLPAATNALCALPS